MLNCFIGIIINNKLIKKNTRFLDKYYLYSVFRQFCFHGQHLPSINIRVVRFIKGLFQLLQLVRGEDGPLKTPNDFNLMKKMCSVQTVDH